MASFTLGVTRRSRYGLLATVACSVMVIVSLWRPTVSLAAEPLQQAQQLNRQGQAALVEGEAKTALDYWQQAEGLYRQANDDTGILGSQLNQAKALQELGFSRRAQALLTSLIDELSAAPTSLLKVNVCLTYGQGLRLLGDVSGSQSSLEEGLAMANALNAGEYQQAAHLYLGNTLSVQKRWLEAADHYQQALTLEGPLQLSSQLRKLQLLPVLGRGETIPSQVQALVAHLTSQAIVDTVPERARTYVMLDLSRWLLSQSSEILMRTSLGLDGGAEAFLVEVIARAQQQADLRAESYGWGYLGRWHERQQQWDLANQETTKALSLSRTIQANKLIYQWQWQQGRIERAQGHVQSAIAHYGDAVETLKPLRQEMVAITREVQFSFREQIEPIYRDLVSLLLSPEVMAKEPQASLEKARQTLEALQLAELNNFFREPCLEAIPQSLESLDPTAAVFYPIIVRDGGASSSFSPIGASQKANGGPARLAVILSVPGQPLIYTSTTLPTAELEAGIQQLLDAMRPTSFAEERLAASQQLYQWLIAPTEATLKAHGIQTLVFVLDDALRNLPLAALYNGSHYLVEDYQLAVSPGLQLLQVQGKTVTFAEAKALVGGLSESVRDRPALVGVEAEVAHIDALMDAQVLLNETFTSDALLAQVKRRSFEVVHLATHAQFGATDAQTFIETWNGRLQINQLRQLLRQQDNRGLPPALLILSACDTAQGNDKAVLGLAGLAVRSGAQSTLATLWSVNDQATAIFIQQFYDGLIRQGLTSAQSIRYAQQQLMHMPAFQHPYYWAPFVLVGDWT
ncbi:MAG: CHAT domain-containing protein [Cyanobacteria bacterium P01_F01_bin.53]